MDIMGKLMWGLLMTTSLESDTGKNLPLESNTAKDLPPLIPEMVALLGAIVCSVFIALPLNTYLSPAIPFSYILAPLVEEPAKMLGVICLVLFYPSSFSSKKRAFVMGGLAGLGFSLIENFFYSIEVGNVLDRAIFPPLGHLCFSATAAVGLALVAKKESMNPLANSMSFIDKINTKETRAFIIIAMLMHGMYNFVATYTPTSILLILPIIVCYYILYKLYLYIPDNLTGIEVNGPIQLLSQAIDLKTGLKQTVAIKYCTECGHAYNIGSLFCPSCGNKVNDTSPVATIDNTQVKCLSCGHELDETTVFCPNCGTRRW
jgi:predicted RNA-binding Zn-ribbon protein involved in translation (DUF1610 family)